MSCKYYPLDVEWKTRFLPLLKRPEVISVKRIIIQRIISTFRNDKNRKVWCQLPKKLIDKFLALNDEKLAEKIDTLAWGKFTVCEKLDDKDADSVAQHRYWKECGKDPYNDPTTLGHYLLVGEHVYIALLIWTLCKLAWPDKTWLIVNNSDHAFVMEEGDTETIYDIILMLFPVPAGMISLVNVKTYKNPLDATVPILGLNPNKSRAELETELLDDWEKNLSMGMDESASHERYKHRLKHEIPFTIAIKSAFSWNR